MKFLAACILLLSLTVRVQADDAPALFRKLRGAVDNPVYREELKKMLPTLTKTNEQALGVTIYGLSCLLEDDLVTAQKCRDALVKRFPDSPYLESFNFDMLASPCHRCSGEGENRAALCERCKGGKRCVACGGKGRIELTTGRNGRSTFCPDCGGTGRCRNCNGTGRKNADCTVCKGRGLVLNNRKIRLTANALLAPYRGKGDPDLSDDK